MAVAPFEHPFLSGLLGDEEVARHFSAEADIAAFVEFEKALAEAEAGEGVIPSEAGSTIAATLEGFVADIPRLNAGTTRDGMAVPDLIRQMREAVGEPYAKHVHFGSTSQDVIDTSLALRLVPLFDLYAGRLDELIVALDDLDERDGAQPQMAHTRMQAAIPVTVSRKIASWRGPLDRHRARLAPLRDELAILHFGGPAGTLEKLGSSGDGVARRMAERLGLRAVSEPRHSERDGIVELASWLSLVSGTLGKMGQDIALLAQSEVGQIRLAAGGRSSAMAHKVNPVDAEVLVTLARFNATLVSGMHQALVHENERSGTAWTLEWMILPQMAVAAGRALQLATGLARTIRFVATEKRA